MEGTSGDEGARRLEKGPESAQRQTILRWNWQGESHLGGGNIGRNIVLSIQLYELRNEQFGKRQLRDEHGIRLCLWDGSGSRL